MPHKDPAARKAYAKAYNLAHSAAKVAAIKKWRDENRELFREKRREYGRRKLERRGDSERNYRAASMRQFRSRMSEEQKAREKCRYKLNYAIRSGLIIKPTNCSHCGRVTVGRNLHAHHADYSLPLEVTWLCAACHGEQHRRLA